MALQLTAKSSEQKERTRVHTVVIGILGILLPILLWLGMIIVGEPKPLSSISHYYFTRVAVFYIGILFALGLFLILYRDSRQIDFWISAIAGLLAITSLFFPTSNLKTIGCVISGEEYCTHPHAITILAVNKARVTIHYITSASFLLLLAFLSGIYFTRTDKPLVKGNKKEKRNRIYRICALIMIVALLSAFLGDYLGLIPKNIYETYRLTFVFETIAVWAFGFSWLTKAQLFFRDPDIQPLF
jgi:hypothetical protein